MLTAALSRSVSRYFSSRSYDALVAASSNSQTSGTYMGAVETTEVAFDGFRSPTGLRSASHCPSSFDNIALARWLACDPRSVTTESLRFYRSDLRHHVAQQCEIVGTENWVDEQYDDRSLDGPIMVQSMQHDMVQMQFKVTKKRQSKQYQRFFDSGFESCLPDQLLRTT